MTIIKIPYLYPDIVFSEQSYQNKVSAVTAVKGYESREGFGYCSFFLTLVLLVSNLDHTNDTKKTEKNTATLAHRYSFESTQLELSNEYQQDRVWRVFKNLCILVLWTKVILALFFS